jgi:quinol monooxygenase YgiN
MGGRCPMVGGLKNLLVKAGQESDFETMFKELRAKIREHEPGCVYYSLLKSRTAPRTYIVEEQYRDHAAWEAHQASEYGKIYFPRIRTLLERITVEYFDVTVA